MFGERIRVRADAWVTKYVDKRVPRYGRWEGSDRHCRVDSRSLICEGGIVGADNREVSRIMSSTSSEGRGCWGGLGWAFEGFVVEGDVSSRLRRAVRRRWDFAARVFASFSA